MTPLSSIPTPCPSNAVIGLAMPSVAVDQDDMKPGDNMTNNNTFVSEGDKKAYPVRHHRTTYNSTTTVKTTTSWKKNDLPLSQAIETALDPTGKQRTGEMTQVNLSPRVGTPHTIRQEEPSPRRPFIFRRPSSPYRQSLFNRQTTPARRFVPHQRITGRLRLYILKNLPLRHPLGP